MSLTERKTAQQPWIEKYRPNTVDQVVYQEEVVQALKKSLKEANLPHLLFYGPPGTGKTSTILAIAKQLFGPELYRSRVLELNASDERGIDVIRTKVKTFAQVAVGKSEAKGNYPCPPFKLIVLDEADSMTKDAQAALRRTMETYSKVTRFCIVCNYVSRIIEPIVSRCAKFRFKALDSLLLGKRLSEIAVLEGLEMDEKTLARVVQVSEGDMRRALTILQSSSRIHGPKLKIDYIDETAAIVPQNEIQQLLDVCIDIDDSSDVFDNLYKQCSYVVRQGHSASQLISQLHDLAIHSDKLSNLQKGRICMEIANTDKSLIDGADEFLQLVSLCSFIMRIKSEMRSPPPKKDDTMNVD
jgi:replication factor C subunit 2/4